jgi:hypothetical protein
MQLCFAASLTEQKESEKDGSRGTHFFHFRRQLFVSTRTAHVSDQFVQFLLGQHPTIFTSLKHVAWHGRDRRLTHLSWHANTRSSIQCRASWGNLNWCRSGHLKIFGNGLSIIFLGIVQVAWSGMCMGGGLCLLLLHCCV